MTVLLTRRLGRGSRSASREVVRDVVLPADRRYLEVLERRVPAGDARGSRARLRARTARPCTATPIRSWTSLDMDPRDVHQVGLDELAMIDEERREIARVGGYGDDVAAYRRALAADPANQAPTPASSGRPGHRGHRARRGGRPAVFGAPAAGRLRGPPGRGVQGAERAVRLLLPAGHRRVPAAASTTSTPTTCPAGRTPSSPRPRTTRRSPGHHFQISLEMEHPSLNVFRRLGARIVGGAYVEGWGLYCGAPRGRAGPLPQPGRAVRDARRPGLARLAADRGLRDARPRLVAAAVDRLAPCDRPVRDGRRHRDGPLHRLAGPGAART